MIGVKREMREAIPKAMQVLHDDIVARTDAFCEQRLNAECAALCRRMARHLACLEPSPLLMGGKAPAWAGALLYMLGTINFLFDESQEPYLKIDEMCSLVGVSELNASGKAQLLMEDLKVGPFNPRWCLPSKLPEIRQRI